MLFGVNKLAPILLAALQIDTQETPAWPKKANGEDWYPYDDGMIPEGEAFVKECIEKKIYMSGRFRDIYLEDEGNKIVLYTRNGGGNRESYPHVFEILASHPNFIRDYDDDFDCTYAYYEFSVPEDYREDFRAIATENQTMTPSEKFQALFEHLSK